MRRAIATAACVTCLAAPAIGRAQTSSPAAPLVPAPAAESFWAPFRAVPSDIVHFFSTDTARILGAAGAGLAVAHRWDDDGIAMALDRLKPVSVFTPGNVGGGVYAQVGGAFAVYAVGRAAGLKSVADVGSDLFRAQVLTQAIVQGMKFSLQRPRPDQSNRLSLPSGHTAGAIATATVLHRHFGWKVGIPAYTAGAYVAASRMSANKHHLTDVMLGAAVGLAAGRTVTIGIARQNFDVGAAPIPGGAAITFTKR